jgi:hypothetical protein
MWMTCYRKILEIDDCKDRANVSVRQDEHCKAFFVWQLDGGIRVSSLFQLSPWTFWIGGDEDLAIGKGFFQPRKVSNNHSQHIHHIASQVRCPTKVVDFRLDSDVSL